MNSNQRTLYDRIGGEIAVALLVDRFYDRVLKDLELEPYFRNVPMEKLLAMQLEFFSAALDGPVRYSGRPIDQVHKGFGITSRQLSRFMRHLMATIEFIHRGYQSFFKHLLNGVRRQLDHCTGCFSFILMEWLQHKVSRIPVRGPTDSQLQTRKNVCPEVLNDRLHAVVTAGAS